jgi:hypothetical protein
MEKAGSGIGVKHPGSETLIRNIGFVGIKQVVLRIQDVYPRFRM